MKNTIISAFEQEIGAEKVLTGEAVRQRFDHIWHTDKSLNVKAVLLPHSTEDVAQIMKICHKYEQVVVVHGGLTNLVGSTETHPDEVVISMERLNVIEEVDRESRTMSVQAGVILASIQDTAKENELFFPLNFGAKGSAQIGGIVSTNAGGLRVFRYGMTRNLVLGLEVVLADGTVISSMKKIIKDNSGYDLKQLFIGSEGTLGVITKVVLKLVEAPQSRNSVFVGINNYGDVVRFLKYMDRGLAGTLSGYELIWNASYKVMTSPPATPKPPLNYGYKYYVLLESLGSNYEKDHKLLVQLLETAVLQNMIQDAVIADNDTDLNWFWTIREDTGILASQCTYNQRFDISIPIPLIGSVVENITTALSKVKGVEQIFPFGHIADGNIHFVVGKATEDQTLTQQINDIVYAPLKKIGGSVSAEHGIGLYKKNYLHLCRTPAEIQLMKTIKQALDPQNILNRGKVI